MHTRTKGEGQISVAIIHFGQLIYRDVSGFLCFPFFHSFLFPSHLGGCVCVYMAVALLHYETTCGGFFCETTIV